MLASFAFLTSETQDLFWMSVFCGLMLGLLFFSAAYHPDVRRSVRTALSISALIAAMGGAFIFALLLLA